MLTGSEWSGVYCSTRWSSLRDDVVIEACNEYGIAMAYLGLRLFHH